LLEGLSSEALSEWIAFDNLYGLPDVYFMTGMICSLLANVFGSKGTKATPADFIPYFREKPRQTTADHRAVFQALADPKPDLT
jgi:hypothetical protein